MKKFRALSVFLLVLLMIAGCSGPAASSTEGQEANQGAEKVTGQSEEVSGEETDAEGEEPETGDETSSVDTGTQEDGQTEKRMVKVYYIDAETAELVSDEVEIENENDIWKALQEREILTEDCKLLSFKVNEEEKTIDLDFNSALGERVRSFGTAGETEIIGCLVNTYLEAYGCDRIRLTEEGGVFETSHGANFDGYTGEIDI